MIIFLHRSVVSSHCCSCFHHRSNSTNLSILRRIVSRFLFLVFTITYYGMFISKTTTIILPTTTTTSAITKSSSFIRTFLVDAMSTNNNISKNSNKQIRIFGFGDSLTAGTSPPEYKEYPYAPHLESALNNNNNNNKADDDDTTTYVVRHAGFPGWTASQLLEDQNSEHGLRTYIKKIQDPSLSLVILLAGTNDLGYQRYIDDITNDIITLHQVCYEENIPYTIAIGIPSSGYQHMDSTASDKAKEINERLQKHCIDISSSSSTKSKSIYMDFPFGYERSDDRWSIDGLHFSPKGYQVLGERIADVVKTIFSSTTT